MPDQGADAEVAQSTIPAATIAPIKPCTRPSTMNGRRMNQLVAPTRRMTPTSRLREKIAIRMAFKISTNAEISNTTAITQQHHLQDVAHRCQGVGRLRGVVTWKTPAKMLEDARHRSGSAGIGQGALEHRRGGLLVEHAADGLATDPAGQLVGRLVVEVTNLRI